MATSSVKCCTRGIDPGIQIPDSKQTARSLAQRQQGNHCQKERRGGVLEREPRPRCAQRGFDRP